MNNFYTYAYLRDDKTPYYIGKGSNGRAYSKKSSYIKVPKDKCRILFLKQNLTEEEAFKHEKYMIAILGRKDLGTGILINHTDGGEGISGYTHSEETKRKISESLTGERGPMYGKPKSEETKRKLSNALSGKNNPNFGKTRSEEYRKRVSEVHKGKIVSEETKKKMSESRKGEKNPNYGKPKSEETKRKLSEKLKTLIWITDGVTNRRISKMELIPSGFMRGITTKNKL